MSFYIFHRHSVCLVDRVDLICSLYSWWEDFGSSSLVTLPLGYNCGFISTSGYESSTGVCSWGCPEGLGFAPVRARCGGGTAAWVAGVLSGERLGDEGREAMVMAPPTTHDSAASTCFHGCWLSSTGTSHHNLLPHIPLICLSTVNSSPCPGIAPQSLNSSFQPLCHLGYVWLWQGLSDSHSI